MTTYGQRDGQGPTAGRTAAVYEILIPDIGKVRKRTFRVQAEEAVATGFMNGGKAHVCIWADQPMWEGEFGRLIARRVK